MTRPTIVAKPPKPLKDMTLEERHAFWEQLRQAVLVART